MKKILSIICSMVLLIAPYNVYAQEIYGDGSGTSTVVGYVESQYCVLIPETINADATLYSFNALVMQLAEGDYVNVTISGLSKNNALPMSGGSPEAVAVFTKEDGTGISDESIIATFYNGELTSQDQFRATLQYAETPGNYTGTVTFNITLQHS